MKLLIIDTNTESQAFCARRIDEFGQGDIEMLDLKVNLANEQTYLDKLEKADVLVIGSALGPKATAVARQALSLVPWMHIIMFVTDEAYGGGAFRAAHAVGVRKVFPDSASPLDFLQELVAILAEFRKEGRTREGKVISLVHAKGGVGTTSIAAALAEVCDMHQKQTLLWDLDVETRDLSRSLTVNGDQAATVSDWINGTEELTRESFASALIPISNQTSVLMPPDRMAEAMDLVCHTDSMILCQRIVELARVMFDVVIIDTAGRMGPGIGAAVRASDFVVLVIDDTVLGLTAVDLYLSFLKNLVGGTDRIVFLVNPYSGALVGISEIAAELEPVHMLGQEPWRLPPILNDPKGAMWPGSGKTLYSLGKDATKQTFERVAAELGLININSANDTTNSSGIFGKLFGDKLKKDKKFLGND